MPQSRVIRFGVLALILGVAFLGLRALPILLSQEGVRPPPTVFVPPPVDRPPVAVPALAGEADGDLASPAGLSGGPPGAGASGGVGSLDAPDPFGGESGDSARPAPGSAGGAPPSNYPARGGPAMPPVGMMPGGMPGMMGSRMSKAQLEELQLAHQAKALLNHYGKDQRPEVKEKLKSDLRAVLHQQFRLQQQRREAELKVIETRVADLRSKLKKRADAQSTIVDRRLEQLISDIDGLGWNSEDVPDNLFLEPTGGGMKGSPMGMMSPMPITHSAAASPARGSVGRGPPPVPGTPPVGGLAPASAVPPGTAVPTRVPGSLPPLKPVSPPKPTLPESGDDTSAGTGTTEPVPPSLSDPKGVK